MPKPTATISITQFDGLGVDVKVGDVLTLKNLPNGQPITVTVTK